MRNQRGKLFTLELVRHLCYLTSTFCSHMEYFQSPRYRSSSWHCSEDRRTRSCFMRRIDTPGGRIENSPAVYCQDPIPMRVSSEGTADSMQPSEFSPAYSNPENLSSLGKNDHHGSHLNSAVPSGLCFPGYKPSLERLGYCQFSLREIAMVADHYSPCQDSKMSKLQHVDVTVRAPKIIQFSDSTCGRNPLLRFSTHPPCIASSVAFVT